MPGLLDLFDSPGAQVGLGLLAAGGPRSDGAGFGQRLMEGLNAGQAMGDAAMKRKMAMLQEQRAQQMFDMQKEAFAGIPGGQATGGGSPAMGGAIGGGMPAQISGGGGDTNAQLVRLEKMALAGVPGAKEAFDIYKYRNDPQQLQPGTFSQNRVTGAREYIPDVKTGMGYGPNGITMLPGAENIAALEAQKTAAQEAAKAGFDLVSVPMGNGQTKMMPRLQAAQELGGGVQSAGVPGRGLDMSRVTPEQMKLLTDPAALSAGVARFQGSSQPSTLGLTQDPAAKDAQELQQARSMETIKTGAKAGADRIMSGYDNARSALDTITSIGESRKAIQGGSFVGAGADTRLNISKGLNALGFNVSPEQVSNTDYLNSQLGQGILNKAKTLGANPTDNDARIIRDIVGSIGKDPQALNRLLDFQENMANRTITQHNKNYTEAKSRGFDAGFDLSVEAPKPEQTPKSIKDYGYNSNAEVIRDAQNTIMRNPKAKGEVLKRLNAMGLNLPSANATGSW